MANKERNKRSARKARAAERAQREAARAASNASAASTATTKSAAKADSSDRAVTKASTKAPAKDSKKSGKKPNIFRRFANYLADVKVEMHRVTWPSKDELKNYSIAVIASLVIFGVALWLIDSGIVAILVGYTSLGA